MTTETYNPTIPGYQICSQIYAGARTKVYRAIRESDRVAVVIKLLVCEFPHFQELVQFRHQYTITKSLQIPGILQPLALETYNNGYILVMADTGEISLREYIKTHDLSLRDFFSVAIQLTNILHNLHHRRAIHKDIKPANILINPQTKQLQLIDFSIASLLPKETTEIKSPNVLEGTLAYISPEQTGRMNRGIDYRSDFYALGVTFYEILTGELPFNCEDPLELIHCHLAKQPNAIINPEIPSVLVNIVMKLLAKNAEDRYQNALGLKHDLETCLAQIKDTGEISNFQIAQRDICDRFLIPEKLYGRESEVNTLLQAFERVVNGTSEMMLVAGFSGIGKTVIINEVHKPITRQKGYFIKGKFDQFNRNIPLSAFVQALRDLMGQLLSESDANLKQWRGQILAALGENAQVIVEVIPELEKIIGKQPSAAELSGNAAQNRFNLLFQNFIAVFTKKQHPLVIFLDDLQWADLASLQLIKLLMEDRQYLLLLGAYRDNEVSPTHPFSLTVEELHKSGKTVNIISLAPLTWNDTNQLVADTLHCATKRAHPLSELITAKTQGNPFFITQFLKALYEDGQITFNHYQGYWECDIAQIKALSLTDDVVEFIAQQLQKLPSETQNILKLAACIGNSFDLDTLAIVCEYSAADVASDLWTALQEGLIIPQSQLYKFYVNYQQPETNKINIENVAYRFLHDRIQQAAYSLIAPAQKQSTHFDIGTLLLEKLSPKEIEERIFEIVNHLNLGQTLITTISQKIELAKLNLLAGTKAKAATAYSGALKYMTAGIELLPDNCWERYDNLSLSLFKERTEIEYLNGNFDQAESWLQQTLTRAKAPLEKAEVYNLAIVQYTLQAKYPEAIQAGREALALVNIHLPETDFERVRDGELAMIQAYLGDRTFSALLDLPIVTQPEQKMGIKLLISMGPPTYRSHQKLWSVICAKAVNLCLQYGNSPEIGYIYPAFGGLRGYALNNYQGTGELLDVTLKLMQVFNNKSAESVAYLMIGSSLRHWSHPLYTASEDYLSSYQVGLASSNLQYAAYAFGHNMYCRFYQSIHLEQLLTEIAEPLAFSQKYKNQWAIDLFIGGQIILSEFLGRKFAIDEANYLEDCRTHKNWQVICIYNILKSQLLLICEQLEAAFNYSEQAEAEIINVAPQGLLPYVHHCFIHALLLLARYPQLTEAEKPNCWQKICQYQQQLTIWAENNPGNFLHLCCLVTAESCRVSGDLLAAIDNYDRAITQAKAHEWLQAEALANELAAKFYLNWGKDRIATTYMQEAYYCYARWGAKAKTDDLEQRYPDLLRPILQQVTPIPNPLETLGIIHNSQLSIHASSAANGNSSSSINHRLDLTTVLKASHSLASKIQLNELIWQLTQIILQHSGGDRCALILSNNDAVFEVKAIVTPDTAEFCSQTLEGNPKVPVKLIQYVKNTQEVVMIDELKTDLPIIDEYLQQQLPKSLLCLPILNHGYLIGILYLQNSTTSGVFTSDRLLILNFLCIQAAISLENARLYEKSQSYAQQLEQSLQILETTQKQLMQDEQALQKQALALLQLSQSQAISQGNLSEAFRELTAVTAQTLQIERVSVWLFDEQHTKINCVDLCQLSCQEHSQGTQLKIADYPTYFLAIKSQPIIAVDDALTDPRTCEFRHGYLDMFNISSMLDASFQVDGSIGGVICCEQVGEKRNWTSAEQNFISSIANLIALTLESHHRQQKTQQLKQALLDLNKSQLQIVQNEKMASLGNLVAGVAHEVNNPIGFLNGSINNAQDYVKDLLGHLELYQQQYPQPNTPIQDNAENIDLEFLIADLPKLLDAMKGATNRIKLISHSLRTFSRADTDRKIMANLHEGIDSTLLILKYRLKGNEHRPAIAIEQEYGDIPLIECFPGQLNQVFMNILANAIDMFDEMAATLSFNQLQAHPQKITISTEAIANQVYIKIRDNGKGMSAEVQAKIFDHLFTTKGVGKGTGLGLAIARQLIGEKHGGSIEVNSVLGEGTEFAIAIPIKA
ncbi:AAA family ATPase [Calothrix sp. FACHB-1219]|uniref:trifunctional serine/threonine-protein kinase/ATP-binding protein/sensor histidine kinase n=1 Tax=unclassified Calothrix TaxID=2619626 RepID=UPI001685A4CC|nr:MULTISPECIES: AAA family ATPase [unclassified Calothrix]MBD2201155.1 AAA family ATPase [Calothrix sp. FACHB-168]MBD2215589.1 AAA family ATPase [Calothrix sp. FACHB-1219]